MHVAPKRGRMTRCVSKQDKGQQVDKSAVARGMEGPVQAAFPFTLPNGGL